MKWRDGIMPSNDMSFVCHSQEKKRSRHCHKGHVVVKGRLLPSGVGSDESGAR
jgi:hypothetical protein